MSGWSAVLHRVCYMLTVCMAAHRGKTWNRILHPDPVLRAHPSWALPQLRARMPSAQLIQVPRAQLRWKSFRPPSAQSAQSGTL